MGSNVRNYHKDELLAKVKSLPNYSGIPTGYWLLGVQSNEDEFNVFDDKFYLFKGERFITVATGTTNAGLSGMYKFYKYGVKGCAVIKTEEWYYDLWKPGLHRGRMKALKQVNPIKYYRDGNKNQKIEEIGEYKSGIIGINFHSMSYVKGINIVKKFIGGWSAGCQVVNGTFKYYNMLKLIGKQKLVSYCLIKEF